MESTRWYLPKEMLAGTREADSLKAFGITNDFLETASYKSSSKTERQSIIR
jgi:hypothetical protein